MHSCMLSCFSHVWVFVTLWTVACQALLSMGFSRQECWSGLPCPPPGDLPHSGIEFVSLTSPALAGEFFTISTTWEAPVFCKVEDINAAGWRIFTHVHACEATTLIINVDVVMSPEKSPSCPSHWGVLLSPPTTYLVLEPQINRIIGYALFFKASFIQCDIFETQTWSCM